MNKPNQYMELVKKIPVKQGAAANFPIKKFLLEKIRLIFNNKNVIEQAKKAKRKDSILDAYKKTVGFEKKRRAIEVAEKKLAKANKEMLETGLFKGGYLIDVQKRTTWDGSEEATVYSEGAYIPISEETVKKIEKVKDLIKAVEGEVEPFTTFDQLETRMMMASTIGEVMAIINAVAGEAVFSVNTSILALPEE